jgi:FlaA1/EpsC-like NDP-sugar epimerase
MSTKLLNEFGFNIDDCKSEIEAINKSSKINDKYPVYYSGSDTTGEKPYEEFYTKGEEVDLDRHKSLGVVTNLKPRPINEIENLLTNFKKAFSKETTTKESIVKIMKEFLVNFDHKEIGKTLDSKM